jgi:hypothetical protein
MMVEHNIEQQTVAGKMENLQQNTSPRTKHAMFRTWASDNKASKQERMLRFGTKSGSAMSSVSPSKGQALHTAPGYNSYSVRSPMLVVASAEVDGS